MFGCGGVHGVCSGNNIKRHFFVESVQPNNCCALGTGAFGGAGVYSREGVVCNVPDVVITTTNSLFSCYENSLSFIVACARQNFGSWRRSGESAFLPLPSLICITMLFRRAFAVLFCRPHLLLGKLRQSHRHRPASICFHSA